MIKYIRYLLTLVLLFPCFGIGPMNQLATMSTSSYDTITYDTTEYTNSLNQSSTTLSNFTLGQASGNNRIVIVGVHNESGGQGTSTGCTFNGTSMTDHGSVAHTGGYNVVEIFYILDASLPATTGDYDIVCSWSGAQSDVILLATSLYNVAQSAPSTMQTAEASTTDTISDSDTTSIDNSWGISVVSSGDPSNALTEDAGQTERGEDTANSSRAHITTEAVTPAGSFTMGSSAASSVNRLLQGMIYVEPSS